MMNPLGGVNIAGPLAVSGGGVSDNAYHLLTQARQHLTTEAGDRLTYLVTDTFYLLTQGLDNVTTEASEPLRAE